MGGGDVPPVDGASRSITIDPEQSETRLCSPESRLVILNV